MPSLMIHLLVGEKFCDKNKIKNKEEFLKGNFAPDLVSNKEESHFTKKSKKTTFTMALINKVDLRQLAKVDFDLSDDFQKGKFLHIVTDYYFYSYYLINEPNYQQYLDEPYDDVKDILYDEYCLAGNWIANNFANLNYDLLPDAGKKIIIGEMKILSKQTLLNFVEFCSNLDMEEQYSVLKTTGKFKEVVK